MRGERKEESDPQWPRPEKRARHGNAGAALEFGALADAIAGPKISFVDAGPQAGKRGRHRTRRRRANAFAIVCSSPTTSVDRPYQAGKARPSLDCPFTCMVAPD